MRTKTKTALLASSILLNAVLLGYGIRTRAFIRKHFSREHRSKGMVEWWRLKTEIYASSPVERPMAVFIGDSQTANFQFEERFPNSLNRGISGDFTDGVRLRISEAAHRHPTMIFIQVGVNDIMNNRVLVKDAIGNVSAAIDTVRRISPSIRIWAQSVLPVRTSKQENDSICAFNAALRELSAAKAVGFIDLYPLMADKGQLGERYDAGDGVHLSGEAYEVWVAELSKHIPRP